MHRSKPGLAIMAALAVALASSQIQAQTLSTVLSFDGTSFGYPRGSLTLSTDGSTLYGMTLGETINNANGAPFSAFRWAVAPQQS